MASVNEIRTTFLEYFKKNGHEVVASSSLVPHNDPTLLFTNAGMVQFKNVFTGLEHRPYDRATTSQKCVRAGGKHNDLDNVGYTARHHTFFEMLGNFSFGDYFKDRAIELAWNLVTKEFGLPADRLTATVYDADEEAFVLWKKIAGLPESRIIKIGTSDNFWAMGDTGPCGPCSEIFFDHGDKIPGGPPGSPDEDGDRFIEIWNLVFMQFEQVSKTERTALPRPSIDTGMGLERIAAVLQGKHDNYEIDLFQRLIARSVELTGAPFAGSTAASHKVIADHLRSSAFLIADGVMPSNDGRGYVLRRIMRRGMRHAQLLGASEPLLWKMVPTLVQEMGKAFPELGRAEAMVIEILKLEETNFRRTLERGLRLLEEETARLPAGAPLAGDTAFRLYDTFGFPLDLTQDALRTEGRSVDVAGFETAMERQRAEARKHWKGSGSAAIEPVWFDLRDQVGATEFLGYETTRAEGTIKGLVLDGEARSQAGAGARVQLIASQTPFYGESGGQVGDTGIIRAPRARLEVVDTRKVLGDLIVHHADIVEGEVELGQPIELVVDAARRTRLKRAHSATHLLHAALRRHLGPHVAQKGSLVAPDRLRFDFSHPKPVTAAEIVAIEAEVNAYLRQNDSVLIRVMARDEAIETGAMALFGEKYGDEVRVVSMGQAEDGHVYSVELCGGTHVGRTGDVGSFEIVSETGVAGGVRRIEALVGEAAYNATARNRQRVADLAALLKVTSDELGQKVEALLDERRRLERELIESRRKLAIAGAGSEEAGQSGGAFKLVGDVKFAGRVLDGVPAKELRGTADAIKKELGSGVVALVSVNDGKAAVVVSLTLDLTTRFDAVDLVKRGVQAVGGAGGGGRTDFAQGGGPAGARAQEALSAVELALT
ncbi:alanyl-tRNA synthetase [Arboricoccus pini]|uniref:Alanine--tRNA ligase n=1 Tax=Arboricoccus pini TaxID=1963835 RepID=A0A212RU63_9PROT|nr:alanine--tRNA ligase [Arboricoccus pini]SNB76087.1 alanyl-tRNA synthetase [Arboricoccus pini]